MIWIGVAGTVFVVALVGFVLWKTLILIHRDEW